jgi:hypothetical protein
MGSGCARLLIRLKFPHPHRLDPFARAGVAAARSVPKKRAALAVVVSIVMYLSFSSTVSGARAIAAPPNRAGLVDRWHTQSQSQACRSLPALLECRVRAAEWNDARASDEAAGLAVAGSSSASLCRTNADMLVIDDPLDNLIDTYTVCPCDPQRRRLQKRGHHAQEGRC